MPSIAEVVEKEGFTPTPSQSEIYRPGAVLVPNANGGHDVVVDDCVLAGPSVSLMSQSSFATTLAGGVSARLSAVRGGVSAGMEKRLSFIDPEQRTIPLGDLAPTNDCLERVARASSLQTLADAFVVNDVLVAMVKSTVCLKSDANGRVLALGEAEASAFSECVQESPGLVPLGFKGVPLDRVLALAAEPVVLAPPPSGTSSSTPDTTEPAPAARNEEALAVAAGGDDPPQEPAGATAPASRAPRDRSVLSTAERSTRRRRLSLGVAGLSGAAGAVMGSIGLAQRADIRDGLQSVDMSMAEAQAQMDAVNRNLLLGYSGLGVGLVVGLGGRLLWSAEAQPGEATLNVRGTW